MSIRDNGIGLQSGGYKQPGKFGLIGIEERVTMLGGTFSLSGSPGGGTTVEVAIPVRQENSDNRPEMDDIRPEKHDQSELV
jgi:glucose-6-phosphate-specific signal transduction histidine kinase